LSSAAPTLPSERRMPQMQAVTSSWIAAIGYGADGQAVYVE
jgi:hypothetical protein